MSPEFLVTLPPVAAVAMIALVAGVSGCSGRAGRSPKRTFEAARRAILEGPEYEKLWDLLSSEERGRESAAIQDQQRRCEGNLPRLTQQDREKFRVRYGLSIEEFINLTPAQAFAAERRLRGADVEGLREVLSDARVGEVKIDGEKAVLEVVIPGEGPVRVELVREHGLYRIPDADGFFAAFRLAERRRRPGRTLRKTFAAIGACIADREYGDLWGLFTPELRRRLSRELSKSQQAARSMAAKEVRRFQRRIRMSLEQYLALSGRELFAAQTRMELEVRDGGRLRTMMLAREFMRGEIEDDGTAKVIVMVPRAGPISLGMKRVDGRWYLTEFK